MHRLKRTCVRLLVYVCVLTVSTTPFLVTAQTDDELRSQIESYNAQLAQIEAEIARYEAELEAVGSERATLENAVRQLDISRQRINANINATRNRLNATTLEITELGREIERTEGEIFRGNEALKEAIRRLDEAESRTLIETLLNSNSVADIWDDIESVQQFQLVMRDRVQELAEAKEDFETAKLNSEEKIVDLEAYRGDLAAQQAALDVNRREKNELLEITEEKESNYQALLDEKRVAKEEFERALHDLEAQLVYDADPSSIPPVGAGILAWPLDSVHITQRFGNTAFAQSGAYSGKGHNGVDFRAGVGTPVRAALAGTVMGVGNTDATRGCYSYGKWVLLRHANGLATLYAHLSEINVSSGQGVATGNVIGYSGNTGYSTGPHLHFTVYVGSQVQIMELGDFRTSRTPCASVPMPVAPLEAYLNPLDYL